MRPSHPVGPRAASPPRWQWAFGHGGGWWQKAWGGAEGRGRGQGPQAGGTRRGRSHASRGMTSKRTSASLGGTSGPATGLDASPVQGTRRPYNSARAPVLPLVGGAVPHKLLDGGGAVPERRQAGIRGADLRGAPTRAHQAKACCLASSLGAFTGLERHAARPASHAARGGLMRALVMLQGGDFVRVCAATQPSPSWPALARMIMAGLWLP